MDVPSAKFGVEMNVCTTTRGGWGRGETESPKPELKKHVLTHYRLHHYLSTDYITTTVQITETWHLSFLMVHPLLHKLSIHLENCVPSYRTGIVHLDQVTRHQFSKPPPYPTSTK
jgi:hypothetical protein